MKNMMILRNAVTLTNKWFPAEAFSIIFIKLPIFIPITIETNSMSMNNRVNPSAKLSEYTMPDLTGNSFEKIPDIVYKSDIPPGSFSPHPLFTYIP